MKTAVIPVLAVRATGVAILSLLVSLAGYGLRRVAIFEGDEDGGGGALAIATFAMGIGLVVAFSALVVVGVQLLLAEAEAGE